jgi:hypothetical protein
MTYASDACNVCPSSLLEDYASPYGEAAQPYAFQVMEYICASIPCLL